MDLNSKENLINELSNLSELEIQQKIDIRLSLVCKQKHRDLGFQTMEIPLDPKVVEWLKINVVSHLNELKHESQLEDKQKFFWFSDYNHEFMKTDHISIYNTERNQKLEKKVKKLKVSLDESDPLYNKLNTNFQMLTLFFKDSKIHFCFYRGLKKHSASKTSIKKRAVFSINSNEHIFFEKPLIELGGMFDFIIHDQTLLIINNRSFEYAFDYTDFINEKRDENLNELINLEFFKGPNSNPNDFKNNSIKYVYARTLAQMKPENIKILSDNFSKRCEDLKKIKEDCPEKEEEKAKYIESYGTVWDLLECIDIDDNKIIYPDEKHTTTLIHFFTDKIMKSFLTERFVKAEVQSP